MAPQTSSLATRAANPRRLAPRAEARPWGRTDLGPWGLGLGDGAVIGELHHLADTPQPLPLLVKTLFTAEMLSVQVHPGDAAARARGLPHGKDEAWVVLAAEPGARIGLGLAAAATAAELRAAALDGSILDRLAWHDCAPGDVFFVPAGTLHAIGAGVTLFEVQQNADVTFRLYDHGRGRPLHLDDGLAVADLGAWAPTQRPGPVLVEGPHFVLERLTTRAGDLDPAGGPLWLAVIAGTATLGDAPIAPGEVWLVEAPARLEGAAELLIAYPGTRAAPIWRAD